MAWPASGGRNTTVLNSICFTLLELFNLTSGSLQTCKFHISGSAPRVSGLRVALIIHQEILQLNHPCRQSSQYIHIIYLYPSTSCISLTINILIVSIMFVSLHPCLFDLVYSRFTCSINCQIWPIHIPNLFPFSTICYPL